MIFLRGHHLLCSVTFTGRGYSRQFERDFRTILKRLQEGEQIQIVSGPDDICRSVKNDADSHCQDDSIKERDALALRDLSRLIGQALKPGDRLCATQLYTGALKRAYKDHDIRSACFDCQWSSLCDTIADEDFKQAILFGSDTSEA